MGTERKMPVPIVRKNYDAPSVASKISSSVSANGFVFVSGQVAFDIPDAPVIDQCRDILARIDRELQHHGAAKSCLVMVTCFVSDVAMFADLDSAWSEWVDPENLPARYTVVAAPASEIYRIEISAQAVLTPS